MSRQAIFSASANARPAATGQRPISGATDRPGRLGGGGPSRRVPGPVTSSQGRGSSTVYSQSASSRVRVVGYASREGTAAATVGGPAGSSLAPARFTRIGERSSQPPAGVGGAGVKSVAITSNMSGEAVYNALVAVGISLVSKASLLGVLMSAVAPSHEESRQPLDNSNKRKRERDLVKGERSSNGIVAAIFCVYSYAFIGPSKGHFSGGQQSNETNNVFLAAASRVWVPAQQGDPDWLERFFAAIMSARAQMHGIFREALIPLALYLIEKECTENNPYTLEDIFRGARERARDLEPDMKAMQDFVHSALELPVSAARRATGKGNLKAFHVFGGRDLDKQLTRKLAVPLALHMLCDAEGQQVLPAGEIETNQCLAERKVAAFAERVNGGFKTKKAREFQNA
ncbi:unnamed protein product [Ectocarpus sp. CCAP 1310/34]|nr:unnamed protein product [Ectocarpus sp. CCAP 1310/34]